MRYLSAAGMSIALLQINIEVGTTVSFQNSEALASLKS